MRDRNDLSKVYTPGVARVCMDIHQQPEHAYRYTIKGNAVAVVSDGTAVLGLGDIGPEAALPVMEGKAMIFKEFANIDAFPHRARDQRRGRDHRPRSRTLRRPSAASTSRTFPRPAASRSNPGSGSMLDIPVFHDDQHGTAVVVLAALINVSRLLKRDLKNFRIVVVGAGAAGSATTKILLSSGVRDIIVCDRTGALYTGRKQGMDPYKSALAKATNPRKVKGSISDAMKGAHVFIGLSAPNLITAHDIKRMAKGPIVFALANPEPEISPEKAHAAGAGHGNRTVGLPEPDQQYARVSPACSGDCSMCARTA